jgi:hypothetical protein
MEKKSRTFWVTPTVKTQLKGNVINMSATVSQAMINAAGDDSLVLKALKRRMALPPTNERNTVRMCVTHDHRIDGPIKQLAERMRLGEEEVIRLSIEAYLNRL